MNASQGRVRFILLQAGVLHPPSFPTSIGIPAGSKFSLIFFPPQTEVCGYLPLSYCTKNRYGIRYPTFIRFLPSFLPRYEPALKVPGSYIMDCTEGSLLLQFGLKFYDPE